MRFTSVAECSRCCWPAVAGIVALALVTAGCMDRDALRRMQDQLNYLESAERRDQKNFERIDSLLTEDMSANREMRADVSTALDDLRSEVAAVKENLADLGDKFDRRGTEHSVMVYPGQGGVDTTRADTVAGTPPASETVTVNCGKLYDQGFNDLRNGNYALAIQSFEEFLRTCASSPDLPRTLYWLGECHYSKDDFAAAIQVFQRLVNEYPDSHWLPGALFKLGRCYERSDQPRHAKEYYERLIKQFPRAAEARPAEARLKALQQSEGG